MYIFIEFYTVLLFIHDLIECVISTYLCMVCSKGIHVCQNEKQRFCESELQSHPPPHVNVINILRKRLMQDVL